MARKIKGEEETVDKHEGFKEKYGGGGTWIRRKRERREGRIEETRGNVKQKGKENEGCGGSRDRTIS